MKSVEITETNDTDFREVIVYHPKGKNLFQKYRLQKNALKVGMKRIQNVNLIHGHVILPRGLQFVYAKKYYNCPLLVTEHGSYFREAVFNKRSAVDKYILKKIRRHIDQLTAVSEFLKKDLQRVFPEKPIDILPNHVNTEVFIPKEKEKDAPTSFLHVSTLDEKLKNPKGIIDACEILVMSGNTDFTLTIVSDEPVQKWVSYTASKNLSNYIRFVGQTAWFDLVPYYQNSDAFVLFSSYETFSIVLAEAWACGIPTLTTSVGIGHELSNELGIQIKINSEESLANAMIEIMKNNTTFDKTKIRANAKQFSEEKIISTFDELIQNLVQ